MIPAFRAMVCQASKSPCRSPTAIMRCGGAPATVVLNITARTSATARMARVSRAESEPLAMPPMSHCLAKSAMSGLGAIMNNRSANRSFVVFRLKSGGRSTIFALSERALRPRKGDRMANWQDPQTTGVGAATVSVPRAARDVGLRSYMLSVYNYMASGVLLTGVVALLFANSPFFAAAFNVVQTARGTAIQPNLLGWVIT